MSNGSVKLRQTNETQELLKDSFALPLLSVIAIRVQRTGGFNIGGLPAHRAFIGDYKRLGLTRQQYRGAKQRLTRWHLAGFTSTNRGTVTTLLDRRICDISETAEQPSADHQATTERPPRNHRAGTNNKEKGENREKGHPRDSYEARLSELLLSLIPERKLEFHPPDLQRWAMPLDRRAEAAPIGAVLDGLLALAGRSGSPSHRSRLRKSGQSAPEEKNLIKNEQSA